MENCRNKCDQFKSMCVFTWQIPSALADCCLSLVSSRWRVLTCVCRCITTLQHYNITTYNIQHYKLYLYLHIPTHHVPPDGHPGDHALAPQHTLLLPHLHTEIIMIL